MSNKEIYERLLKCARTDRKNWSKCDKLSSIEQDCKYYAVFEGIKRAALYLLSTDDYFRWCKEVTE